MKPKVVAYVIVISAMVAAAAGPPTPLLFAAVTFYLFDICVARNRLVSLGSSIA
jgi:hypothetical protein